MEKARIEMGTQRQCLECSATFKGRSDKKYCSDFCRNAWNNRLNRDCNNLIRQGNNRLRRNYRIMSGLLGRRIEARIPTVVLLERGFDFNWYTRVVWKEGSIRQYSVYTLGYRKLPGGYCQLLNHSLADAPDAEIPISSCVNSI